MYSIVTPIYQDHYLIEGFCKELEIVFQEFLGMTDLDKDVELLLISDGGGQADVDAIRQACEQFSFVRGIALSRNFGQHVALMAGYRESRGEQIAMLNVDQQDPISELPKFFRKLSESDNDIVYGRRAKREGSKVEYVTSILFNLALNKLTGNKTLLNLSTMRVMSRRFVDAINRLGESSPYIPGLEQWIGFNVAYVDTIHVDRKAGNSSYTFKSRLQLAIRSIMGFSDYPMRLMAYAGFLLSFISFLSAFAIIIVKASGVNFQAGYPSIVCLVAFFSGLILSSLGLTSLYVGRILSEVQNRPLYIVKDRFGKQPEPIKLVR